MKLALVRMSRDEYGWSTKKPLCRCFSALVFPRLSQLVEERLDFELKDGQKRTLGRLFSWSKHALTPFSPPFAVVD